MKPLTERQKMEIVGTKISVQLLNEWVDVIPLIPAGEPISHELSGKLNDVFTKTVYYLRGVNDGKKIKE